MAYHFHFKSGLLVVKSHPLSNVDVLLLFMSPTIRGVCLFAPSNSRLATPRQFAHDVPSSYFSVAASTVASTFPDNVKSAYGAKTLQRHQRS